jgi:hypothetical protein
MYRLFFPNFFSDRIEKKQNQKMKSLRSWMMSVLVHDQIAENPNKAKLIPQLLKPPKSRKPKTQ